MSLGVTVAEAKQRLSYGEALQWLEYRRTYGGLGAAGSNRLLAMIATLLSKALGGEAEFEDFFMTKEREASIEDVMKELGKALS